MIETIEGKKYCTQEGLSAYCIKLLLGCDQQTADKFADWHMKHVEHKVGCIVSQSALDEKDNQLWEVKKENEALKLKIASIENKIKGLFND